MGTAVTLAVEGVTVDVVDRFFARIGFLESLLSRFRQGSQLSRVATGELRLDAADPAVRAVLTRCENMRRITEGCFEYEPQKRTGDPADPVLDANALAKGWIIQESALLLRLAGATAFFVNAGGDVLVERSAWVDPWRVGVQHPDIGTSVLGVLEVNRGCVATSGTYERGEHIRMSRPGRLASVTVVGPDLADADAFATAVHASGESSPTWWSDVDSSYGLLTMVDDRLRWSPPTSGPEVYFSHNA